MKTRTKKYLVFSMFILISIGLFACTYILPEADTDSISGEADVAPGSLEDPQTLPKADQSDIGESVTLSFAQILEDTQYDEMKSELAKGSSEYVRVAYIYNPVENTGRLIVITELEISNTLSCLTVYEPEWVGGEGLFANLDKEFQAKIIHRVNITRTEGKYYFSQMIWQYKEDDPTVEIDIPSYLDQEQQEIQSFYGSIFYTDSDDAYKIQEGVGASFICCEMSRRISGMCDFMLVIERYDLAEYLGF